MIQVWEYQTVVVSYNSSNGLPIVAYGNAERELLDHIRELGEHGWELAGITPRLNQNREFMMVFKRPKGQDKFPNT